MGKKMNIALWFCFGLLTVLGLIFANKERNKLITSEPVVSIAIEQDPFVTKQDILIRLKRMQLVYDGQQMDQVNISAIEDSIKAMPEIESVEVFKKMGNQWEVNVKARQPIARIFNTEGESFYLDKFGKKMATSSNFSARILVFSGNIQDRFDSLNLTDIMNNKVLKSKNSLDQIYRISNYVCKDPFLSSQITQVFRNQWGEFILVPQVGCQEILFGTANNEEEVTEKLNKLKTFYKDGISYEGWEKYKTINLKYKNQVVCKKRIEDESERKD
jgi:cell division protein FtsQ